MGVVLFWQTMSPPLRVRRLGLVAVSLSVLALPSASGASVNGSAGGLLIAPGRTSPSAVSDGAGGAIVASRDPTTTTAVVNRYSPAGAPMWDQGLSFDGALGVELLSDGDGGAIVAVPEPASGTVGVGRILHGGATTWQASLPSGIVASGGDGGVWVVSQQGELYAQGVTPDGFLRSRVQLSNSPDSEALPAAVGDGAGGAYFAWRATVSESEFALRLQHVDALGQIWESPAEVAGSSEPALEPHLSPDGAGGVLVSWVVSGVLWVHDYDADGLPAWDTVHTIPNAGSRFHLAAASPEGAFVVWTRRLRPEPRAVEQLKVTSVVDGGGRWTRTVATVDGGVLDLRAVSTGDAIVVGWQSALLGPVGAVVDADLSVARITAAGGSSYGPKRQPLANSFGPDAFGALVDGGGGAAVAVFTQSPCLRADASGVAMQLIGSAGERALAADGTCP